MKMPSAVGLSRYEEENKLMYTLIGTPQFSALEILRDEEYGPQVDLWSCGVMCYNMLTGMLPFTVNEVLETFSTGEVHVPYPDESWVSISKEAMQFTKQLLCKNPHVRISALGALCSSWLTQDPGHVWKDLLADTSSTSTDSADRKQNADRSEAKSVSSGSREEELMAAAISQATRKRWRAATISVRALIRLGGLEAKATDLSGRSLSHSSFASVSSCAESDWDYSEADYDALSHVNSLDSCAHEFQGTQRRSEIINDPSETLEEAARKWQESVVTQTGDGKPSTRQDRGGTARSNFARVSMTEGTNGRNFQRNRDSLIALEVEKDDSKQSTEMPSASPSAVSEHAKTPLSPGRYILSKLSNVSSVKGIFRTKKQSK